MAQTQIGIRTGNTKLLQVYITPEDKKALERLARVHNTSVGEIVRRNLRNLITSTASLVDKEAVA